MSRAEQEKRRKRRKERKAVRNRTRLDWFDDELPPDVAIVSDCLITPEPVILPEEREDAFHGTPLELREQLHIDLISSPAAAISKMEPLLEQFPNSRMLLNWLQTAYATTGQMEKSDALIRRSYESHPTYLFARMNYCRLLMREDKLDEVKRLMEGKWDLKSMYPHRNVFHVSEFVAFASMAVEFYIRTRQMEAAISTYETLNKIAPDHPATRQIMKMFERLVTMCNEELFMESLIKPLKTR